MIDLHQRYGKLVRTGPNEVSVSDLAAIKKIYGPGTKFRKSSWYGVFQGHRKFDLFAEQDERIHSSQRRLVSSIYSENSLKDLEKYVDDAVMHFMAKMSGMQGQGVDMGLWVQLFAFDVIGELTFSKRFGFMDAGKDDGSFAQIDTAMASGAWLGQIPALYWAHDYLMPLLGNHLGVNARHGNMRNYVSRELEDRKNRGSDHQDILGKLFQVQKEKPKRDERHGRALDGNKQHLCWSLPRVIPPEGIEIDGRYIPKGTIIGANPWVVHRNTEVFGQDCEKFRPERWLTDNNGNMGIEPVF
ncbi:hypothetical protein MMC12_001721 [Toensbergia leucococca]|nr:hypothetical protein [Toensbergia leucococca]